MSAVSESSSMENFFIVFDETNERHVIRGEGIETIGELKNRIQQEYQIDVNEQIIQYQERVIFNNDQKIGNLLGIKNDKKMTVYMKKDVNTLVPVDIVCQGAGSRNESCKLKVCLGHTVSILKEQINKKLGYGPFRQTLSVFGKLMKDGDLLRDYIINETPSFTCTIAIEGIPKNYVFVEFNKEQEAYHLEQEDTIYTLEHKFRERHNLPESYCNFYFSWQGQQLAGPFTLKQLGIRDNVVLGFSEYKPIVW
ncbi:hypothetical protein FRX31_017421 [Thalictrum thalictroides]|uniref:Ubiquitin-like domain-containing protein n=1 Tax=Thalictrum thalictroides TaxID=46969 RepID=A0A7J6W6I9_THATH|nr:hypothetical protein FRX31_017421 [Thalictrum thalictroides]